MRSVLLALLVGCAVEAPVIETIEAKKCTTCDDNGLPPASWSRAPAELSPSALATSGLFAGGTVRAICEAGTSPTGSPSTCDLDSLWSAWAGADTYRHDLVRYMIKTGAPYGTVVLDAPSSAAFEGSYGLAPEILTTAWGTRAQSLVTAAMAVNVDYYANKVEICLKTPSTPDCPATYSFQEIAATGNLFANQLDVVVGGYAALRPEDSRRVCPGFGGCSVYGGGVRPYYAATCTYGGPMAQRYPMRCVDAGVVRPYAVQVFMETDPSRFGAVAAGSGRPMR